MPRFKVVLKGRHWTNTTNTHPDKTIDISPAETVLLFDGFYGLLYLRDVGLHDVRGPGPARSPCEYPDD